MLRSRRLPNSTQRFAPATRRTSSSSSARPLRSRAGPAPEQAEFLTKALADEISPEGLAVLQREGSFGPLATVFAAEAEGWAKQGGVKVEDCVAFKLERNGLRAEVVLAAGTPLAPRLSPLATSMRILRCNNVKQLALSSLSTPISK